MNDDCTATDPAKGYACTRQPGHEGPHVATLTSETVLATWTEELTPTPEPRTLTWRKDGSGCTWDELEAEFREGRQAERVMEFRSGTTVTHRGPLERWSGGWIIASGYPVVGTDAITSVTVWLPEAPEVPDWAQDCEDWAADYRLVVTEDGRVWTPYNDMEDAVTVWRARNGDEITATTEELAAMGARLIVDRNGKAVQR